METDKSLVVFLVDDDPQFRMAMEHYLLTTIPGTEVCSFPNGEACLHELSKQPDIVLLDYMLNSEFPYAWDGLHVLKKINQADQGIFVVILSSQENIEKAMECIQTGALEYVVKNEKTFARVRDIISGIQDELTTEELVALPSRSNRPQIVGLVLLIVFIIILLLKL
jgi:two-component system OmpR family response regulator